MNVCHCGAKFNFDQATIEPSPPGWQATAVYRCGRCNNISHAVPEAAMATRSPASVAAPLSADHLANGQVILKWDTPAGKVEVVEFRTWPRKVPMSSSEPLIFSIWELLMTKVEIIMGGEPDSWLDMESHVQWKAAKNEARGIAEALAILMHPFMESADHVVRCAVSAYKDSTFEVPGLARHLWDPTKNYDGSVRTPVGRKPAAPGLVKKQAPAVPQRGTKPVDPADAEGIRLAVAGGVPKQALCEVYGVSMAALEAVLK